MPRYAADIGPPLAPGESRPPVAVKPRAPGRRDIAAIVGLALALNLVLGTVLQSIHIRWGLVISQGLFIAGPVLVGIRWFHLDGRSLLPMRRPRGAFLGATLAGTLSLNHLLNVAGGWHERFLPPPEAYSLFYADLFVYRGPADFAIVLCVFALVPAVCEEVLFRGFLLRGLLAVAIAPGRTVAIQAMIFSLFHFDPWRLPEILALGLFLGFLTQRSGTLIPAILAHACNNALSIALAAAGRSDQLLAPGLVRWSVPVAGLLLAAGLLAMHRTAAGRPRERML